MSNTYASLRCQRLFGFSAIPLNKTTFNFLISQKLEGGVDKYNIICIMLYVSLFIIRFILEKSIESE